MQSTLLLANYSNNYSKGETHATTFKERSSPIDNLFQLFLKNNFRPFSCFN